MTENGLTAEAITVIDVPVAAVWEALTTPRFIKQYFFGADIITDWKEGSPILYRGQWEGKTFEDKGTVLKVQPGRLLVVTHWSPLSGTPDAPAYYHTVRYELSAQDNGTRVSITQTNNANEDERQHSEQNWNAVLQGLKRMLEG